MEEPKLPTDFKKLRIEYCSLGYDISYYKKIRELSLKYNIHLKEILDGLRDAACFSGIREKFEEEPAFRNSLLRESESKTSLIYGEAIINGGKLSPYIHFTFNTHLKNLTMPHTVVFKFNRIHDHRSRIFAIIGKNGTGKTRFLSNLANAMSFAKRSDVSPTYQKKHRDLILLEEHETGTFNTELGPPFGKILALSYSLFDSFKRPEPSYRFSYVYCGIRNKENAVYLNHLKERHLISLREITKKRRINYWYDQLSHFVQPEKIGYQFDNGHDTILNIDELSDSTSFFLSSGESMLIYTLTQVIAYISENSLILYDEPETHLHPNAIANLITILYNICDRYDSFMILATHSPIVIQKIPSSNVYIFERDEDTPITRPLEIESLGENLTVLTKHVFETSEVIDGFKIYLEQLSKVKSYEEIISLFQNPLSLNAEMFLKSLYLKRNK